VFEAVDSEMAVVEVDHRSSASTAVAYSGTARLLSLVLVCLTRPFAYARRIMHDPCLPIHVAVFEREQLRRSKPGRGGEQHHRPTSAPQRCGDRPDLLPRVEWPLLPAPPTRIRHPAFRRVLLEQPPRDGPV
jgi:hypothetical protein